MPKKDNALLVPKRRLGGISGESWATILILVSLVISWEIVVRWARVPEYLVPAPSRIWQTGHAKASLLAIDFCTTLLEAMLGFLLANALSLIAASGFFYSRVAERVTLPLLIGLKSVPIIASAPLLVLWFGYGLTGKVVMAAIVAFFPLVIGAITGIRSVSVEALDLMRSLSATRWEILTKLCLPAAVPHILAALKVSATLAVVGAIVGELSGARYGLGFTILVASYNVDTPLLFCGIVLSAIVGCLMFFLVLALERGLWRYHLGRAELTQK